MWNTDGIWELGVKVQSLRSLEGVALVAVEACVNLGEIGTLGLGASLTLCLGGTAGVVHGCQTLDAGTHSLACAHKVDLLIAVILVDALETGAGVLWSTNTGSELEVHGISNAISLVHLFQGWGKPLASGSFGTEKQFQGWLVGCRLAQQCQCTDLHHGLDLIGQDN